jgi:hypothetical protein
LKTRNCRTSIGIDERRTGSRPTHGRCRRSGSRRRRQQSLPTSRGTPCPPAWHRAMPAAWLYPPSTTIGTRRARRPRRCGAPRSRAGRRSCTRRRRRGPRSRRGHGCPRRRGCCAISPGSRKRSRASRRRGWSRGPRA